MGLLNFVKEAGEKLFGSSHSSADKAEKLKKHIEGLGLSGVDNVDVKVDDNGKAVISGQGASQDLVDKILVAAGNVEGISNVENQISVAQPGPENRYYTVKKGDTLSSIAKAEYGNAGDYMKIFEANKPMLSHPDKIYPGQVLIIPAK